MSLCPRPGSHVSEDTARVARAAFPQGNPYLTLRDALETMDADRLVADLFPPRGQAAESPGRLALGGGVQFADNLADRQAADAVRSRIDWQSRLGLALLDPGWDFSLLSACRARRLVDGVTQRVLDALLERFRERGWLRERGKQRTDSTHIQAAARNLNRVECGGDTMRYAWHSLAELAPPWVQAQVPDEGDERYGPRCEQ